jgi:hypothetical protein
MEVGAGGMVRGSERIMHLAGDPQVEFAKAVLRAAGRPFDPMWTKERLLLELQRLTETLATAAHLRARAEEEVEREQVENAALSAYPRGTAPTDAMPVIDGYHQR